MPHNEIDLLESYIRPILQLRWTARSIQATFVELRTSIKSTEQNTCQHNWGEPERDDTCVRDLFIGASLSEPHINGTAVRDFYYIYMVVRRSYQLRASHMNCTVMRNIYVPALFVLAHSLCMLHTRYAPRVSSCSIEFLFSTSSHGFFR